MEKLVFENKHCKISLDEEDKYYVVLKKEHSTIREYQSFKLKDIIDHYSYTMKYDPNLKWYFVVPILLALFILPMVWIDLLRDKFESTSFWRSFEIFSMIVTFTSFAMFFLYLCIDRLFDVRFVSRVIFLFIKRKRQGYILRANGNEHGIEIPLESQKEHFELIKVLGLKDK